MLDAGHDAGNSTGMTEDEYAPAPSTAKELLLRSSG